MSWVIGRPINGITLNGNEYVLDENGDEMQFETNDKAKSFLFDHGLTDELLESQGIFIEEVI